MRDPILRYHLTDHAKVEMARRQISEQDVARTLASPEQTDCIREGREIYQARIEFDEPLKLYLLRVFVDIDRDPPEVVTVYRTSRINKYWRNDT